MFPKALDVAEYCRWTGMGMGKYFHLEFLTLGLEPTVAETHTVGPKPGGVPPST